MDKTDPRQHAIYVRRAIYSVFLVYIGFAVFKGMGGADSFGASFGHIFEGLSLIHI